MIVFLDAALRAASYAKGEGVARTYVYKFIFNAFTNIFTNLKTFKYYY
jgi:hypothetical protein